MNGIKGIDPQGTHRQLTTSHAHTWPLWTLLGRGVLLLAMVMPAWANPSIPAAPSAFSALPKHVPELILVKPKQAAAEREVQALFASHGASQVEAIEPINVRVLHVPEARLENVLAALQKNPTLEFAEPNLIYEPALVPNDTYYSFAWHLPKIQAPQAWDITTGSSNVIIAILDTGVEASHPDLAAKIAAGWNFYDGNNNTADVTGHGTMVAGGAAALSNNGMGVASPAWRSLIMPVRISDTTGSASDLTIAKALSWVADQGVRVANVSYAVSQSSAVTSAAQYLQSKGGVVTV